ncbi:unnamed protein product, partial [Adineta ricciae]
MALNDALNKSTLTLHSSKKIGRLLMPTENGPTTATTTITPAAGVPMGSIKYDIVSQYVMIAIFVRYDYKGVYRIDHSFIVR